MRNAELGSGNAEVGSGNAELGMRNWECGSGKKEVGSGTRRRPIGRDYAAAKDAECGSCNGEGGMRPPARRGHTGLRPGGKLEIGMWIN
jgi:hypothetical protein